MYLKNQTFCHDLESIYEACGSSKQTVIRVRERAMYHCITYALVAIQKQLSGESARSMDESKTSYILKNFIDDITSVEEYEIGLLMFFKVNDVIASMIKTYIPFMDDSMPSFICKLVKEQLAEMDKNYHEEQRDPAMSPMNLFNRIDMVKQSDTFDDYMRRYIEAKIEPVHTDIDKMLESVFNFD